MPKNATNQKVDYSIAWAQDASLKDSDVTEYVKVIQDSDGSLSATVRCYKAFANDKIVITCTTRDGNKTATCEVTYKGLATSMNITSANGLSLSNTEERGDYYLLYTGNDYDFNVELKDSLGCNVNNSNLQIEYDVVGSTLVYGCYIQSSDNSFQTVNLGLTKNSELVINNPLSYLTLPISKNSNETSLEKERQSRGADEFNTINLSNNQIKITPNSTVEMSYCDLGEEYKFESSESYNNENTSYGRINKYFNLQKEGVKTYIIPESKAIALYVPSDEDEYTATSGIFESKTRVYDKENGIYRYTTISNSENLAASYFYVTIRDSVSGLAQTIRFWTVSSVNGVSLYLSNIEF